jgi:hypothetical protein
MVHSVVIRRPRDPVQGAATLDVTDNITASDFCEAWAGLYGIPSNKLKLVFNGRILPRNQLIHTVTTTPHFPILVVGAPAAVTYVVVDPKSQALQAMGFPPLLSEMVLLATKASLEEAIGIAGRVSQNPEMMSQITSLSAQMREKIKLSSARINRRNPMNIPVLAPKVQKAFSEVEGIPVEDQLVLLAFIEDGFAVDQVAAAYVIAEHDINGTVEILYEDAC